jgi:hypothetical protein
MDGSYHAEAGASDQAIRCEPGDRCSFEPVRGPMLNSIELSYPGRMEEWSPGDVKAEESGDPSQSPKRHVECEGPEGLAPSHRESSHR